MWDKTKSKSIFLIICRKSRSTLLNHTLALSVIQVWLTQLNAAVIPKPHAHTPQSAGPCCDRKTNKCHFLQSSLLDMRPIDWRVYGGMQRLPVHSDQHIPEENSSISWVQQNVVRFATNEEATTLLRLYVKSCCFDRHFACVKWNRAVGKCTRSACIEPTGTSANKPAPSTKFNSSELISAFSFGTSVFHQAWLQEVGCITIALNHKNNRIYESEQLDERIPFSQMKGFGRHSHQQSAHAEMAVLNLRVYTDIHTQYITLCNLCCLPLPLPSVETAWAAWKISVGRWVDPAFISSTFGGNYLLVFLVLSLHNNNDGLAFQTLAYTHKKTAHHAHTAARD